MESSKSDQMAQIPISCQLCETDAKIEWKCENCDLLMCERCKIRIHLKIKETKDHRVINIKEVGQQDVKPQNTKTSMPKSKTCQLCETNGNIKWKCEDCELMMCDGCKTRVHLKIKEFKDHRLIAIEDMDLEKTIIPCKIKTIKQYTTELRVLNCIFISSDETMWLSDSDTKRIQKIQLEQDKVKVLLSYRGFAFDMELLADGHLLMTDNSLNLKLLGSDTNGPIPSKFSFNSLLPIAVHRDTSNRLLIACVRIGLGSMCGAICGSMPSGGAVVVMTMEGHPKVMYEFDKNNQQLFTFPIRITATKQGEIFVLDRISKNNRGRVVILADEVHIYNGHPEVNSGKHPFKPMQAEVTKSNNVIIADSYNNTLHILDHSGHLLTYCKTAEAGIIGPLAMAFIKPGKLVIGNALSYFNRNTNAKLYEVEIPEDF